MDSPPAVRWSSGLPVWPPADDDIRQALEAAWLDGSWGRYEGRHGERLTSTLAAMHGVPHVLACCSGTFAVELALRGLNIAAGDEVILAGYDFPGNFRAIEALAARPVLVDIQSHTWCLDPEQIEAAIGPKTRAVLVSHLHGGLAPMRTIVEIARRRDLLVVEDACQAAGAVVDDQPAGSWGDVGVLSFGGSKLLTAGRGGALLTRRADVLQRAKIFCERGNHAFPLSELQAAVLVPQLAKLHERNQRRLENVRRLLAATHSVAALEPLRTPGLVPGESGVGESGAGESGAGDQPSFYKLAWMYHPAACGERTRDVFLAALHAEGVPVDAGFRGFVDRSDRRCRKASNLNQARRAAQDTVLLHHPVLLASHDVIDRLAQAIREIAESLGGG